MEEVKKSLTISVWVSREVNDLLEKKSIQLGRSKSWLMNMALREKMGLPPDDRFEGKDKI